MKHENIVNISINDEELRKNLRSAMHTLQKNRQIIIDKKFDKWQDLRLAAKSVKNKALNSLYDNLLKFEENAKANGFIIHWASNGEEACKIVYDLMKEKNIGKILKGKSMASEEIGLNHYLKEKNIQALETDLGEVIIQLIDEAPVHIVVPAIHKNRYQIGKIFHEELNAPLESDPEKLNAIARDYLREEFKTLEMGLGGVNVALAEEGAIWMIENEGNGRMCTTIPDVLVSICGIEKVVQNANDASILLNLLTPSATGQFIPNYNNIIAGPRREGELDGPKECHIILLDNHRSKMLANDDYYEALRCIRCGACMNFCPVYDKISGHAYQATYPGPIGEVISPQIFGMDKHGDIISFCSLCGRCSEVCPVKIPLAEMIRKLRRDKVGQGSNPPFGTENIKPNKSEGFAFKTFEKIATNGFMFRKAMASARFFNGFIHKNCSKIPVIKKWCEFKDLPEFNFNIYKEVQEKGVSYE